LQRFRSRYFYSANIAETAFRVLGTAVQLPVKDRYSEGGTRVGGFVGRHASH